jgi:group II intron reverse transcriptase/maturase
VADIADVELERRPKRNRKQSALTQLCELSYLHRAWEGIGKNPHSFGIDNVSIDAFRNNLDAELSRIRSELLAGKYKFQKLRGVAIPKAGTDKIRPIQVPAIRDRVVAKAIAHLIEADLRNFDHEFSFGYRTGLSRNDAIAAIHKAAASGLTWVLEADITNFFGKVNNELLFAKLFKVISKPSIKDLLKAAVVNEIGNRDDISSKHEGSFPRAGEGIPQGAILSPMLANFYLSTFDREMQRRGLEVIRYADDFVVMCESEARAKHAFVIAKGYMEGQLKLSMHDLGASKTRIVEYQGGFTFLGYDVRQGKHFPSQASIKKRLALVDKAFEHPRGKPLLPIIIRISGVLSGWKEAYKGSEMTEAADRINSHVAACVTTFFRENGFTHDGRTVTHKQLHILGIPTI